MVSVLMQIAPKPGDSTDRGPGRRGRNQGRRVEMIQPEGQEGSSDEASKKSKQRAKSKQGKG